VVQKGEEDDVDGGWMRVGQ